MKSDPQALQLAWQIARLLDADRRTTFYKQVRLKPGSLAPLTLASLCPQGATDLGTSLVGLTKVGPGRPPEWLVSCMVAAIEALKNNAPELLADDKVLTPPPDGTRGTANLLVGLGMALAYRLLATGSEKPTPRDLARLTTAARGKLNLDAKGTLASPARRKLLGGFVREFFADLPDLKKLDGVPVGLLTALSTSAFGTPSSTATAASVQPQRPPLRDREQQAVTLLRDPEGATLTDREIGRRCGLDGKTVKNLRQEVPQVRKTIRKGRSYLINVSGIGKGRG